MTVYDLLRFVHVLLAITAVGANITYGVWLGRAAREPQHLDHVLRGVAILDSRVANPSYIMLFVTGVILVFLGNISWRTSWLLTAIVLYAAAAVLAAVWYGPLLRTQLAALRRSGAESDEYRALDERARTVGISVTVLVLAVVYLMVTKPTLW